MKLNEEVKDMFGNLIQEGDYIAYPGRQGSDLFVRIGKVHKLASRTLYGGLQKQHVLKVTTCYPNGELKPTTISEFHRATILPKSYVQNSKYHLLLDI